MRNATTRGIKKTGNCEMERQFGKVLRHDYGTIVQLGEIYVEMCTVRIIIRFRGNCHRASITITSIQSIRV